MYVTVFIRPKVSAEFTRQGVMALHKVLDPSGDPTRITTTKSKKWFLIVSYTDGARLPPKTVIAIEAMGEKTYRELALPDDIYTMESNLKEECRVKVVTKLQEIFVVHLLPDPKSSTPREDLMKRLGLASDKDVNAFLYGKNTEPSSDEGGVAAGSDATANATATVETRTPKKKTKSATPRRADVEVSDATSRTLLKKIKWKMIESIESIDNLLGG